ncbi:hypothetical protein CBS101457_006713 [Exobasidium rhododendri]|nr:hypothetical protein CBS101457_006713 [Exobasidium rhododendri]
MSSSSPSTSSEPSHPRAPPMYYCHECAIEIRPLMVPNPTCPRCNGEFVEEIDPSNPIQDQEDDDDAMQEVRMDPLQAFAGAARRSDVDGSSPVGQGLDIGTLMGGILRGLATAGSQTRPAGNDRDSTNVASGRPTTNNVNDGNVRTGVNQVGPVTFSWGMGSYQATNNASYATTNARSSTSDSPFAERSPMGLNEYVRRSFENHQHDDGMGGAGGAADGRFFNMDNQNTARRSEPDEDNVEDRDNENRFPPELASIRDVFTNLFGGMADGPAGMLVDLFGGGTGRGRTGDYVWGQQGLDDVITQLMEQTRGSTAPPPASEEAIAKLVRFSRKDKEKLKQARNRECSTCMDSFQEEDEEENGVVVEPSLDSNRLSSTLGGNSAIQHVDDDDDPPEVAPQDEQQDELIMMPCKHLFHEDCLLPWLKTNGTCPVCRVSLEPKKEQKESNVESGAAVDAGNSSAGPSQSRANHASNMDDEDESPEAIRQRSRRAAEARSAGQTNTYTHNSGEQHQTVPGSFLQPDELD